MSCNNDTMIKKHVIVYRESLLQSIISDAVTFGCLFTAILISKGDVFWSIVCFSLLWIFVLGNFLPQKNTFHNKQDLRKFVDEL